MIKTILLTIFLFITLNASPQNATKDDIKMLIHQMDKRFEQVDKRLESMQQQTNKRFESMQQQTNKQFESMQQQTNKQFESMQQQTNKRFESMQQQTNKQFEQADKRFDTMIYLLVGGFTLIMGYLLKERTIIAKQIKQELTPDLVKKADKNILDKVIAVIEDMAKKDKDVENMLIKHHLRLA